MITIIPILIISGSVIFIAAVIFVRNWISQLSFQNRLLTALRRLDVAATSSVEIEPLSQAIVEVIRRELGYLFSVIALVDYKLGVIKRVAIAGDEVTNELLRNLPVKFQEQRVPLNLENNSFVQSVKLRRGIFTENMADIQRGVLPESVSADIQKKLNIKGVFIYPLIIQNRVIGVIEYPITVKRENISKFAYTIMEEFTTEAARVLDNASLYQDLKETSEQLSLANQKLQEVDQMKDELISITSHELRTPMTAIRSYVWMALHKSDLPLSQKVKKYLYRTLTSTERLIDLVSDMLRVSTLESGRIAINPKPFNVLKVVHEVVEEVKMKASEKRLQLTILDHLVPAVFADPEKVHQILLNLIGNALKYTYPGGTITIGFFTDGRMVEVSIKDNGRGMSRDDLGKLFHKFSRLDNSYTAVSTSGGTGLGLYISKSLVELMHGSIWAQSEGVDKGSTFTFSLPLATQDKLTHISSYQVRAQGEIKELEPAVI